MLGRSSSSQGMSVIGLGPAHSTFTAALPCWCQVRRSSRSSGAGLRPGCSCPAVVVGQVDVADRRAILVVPLDRPFERPATYSLVLVGEAGRVTGGELP